MAKTKTGYVSVNDGKLYYEVAGEGDTLVLVHAGFVDSGMWDAQWDAFTKQYRVIRFDMRGYGKSDLATGPVSRRGDLFQVLEQLDMERAALIGCSLGGEVVMDVALEHPDRVSALVVVSAVPSGFQMQGEPPAPLMAMMEAAQKGDLEKTSELQIQLWVDGPSRQPGQVNAAVRQQAAAMNRIAVKNGTFFTADSQPLNPLDPPAATRLKDIHIPTLIIAGALDNSEILRAADVMAKEIKGAKKVVIEDAAHVPNMEKPEAFNRAVLDFLDAAT